MRWTWDPAKAASNLQKHGVSFKLAAQTLGDPLAVTYPDPCPDEERWRTIGKPAVDLPAVLFVVHTWPDDETPGRIVSARQATSAESRAYEEG